CITHVTMRFYRRMDAQEIQELRQKARDVLKISRDRLAAEIGVSTSTFQRWERGEITPNPREREMLEAIDQIVDTAAKENPEKIKKALEARGAAGAAAGLGAATAALLTGVGSLVGGALGSPVLYLARKAVQSHPTIKTAVFECSSNECRRARFARYVLSEDA